MSFWGTILFEYPQPCTFFRSPGVFVGSVGLNFDAETIHAHALQICPLIDTGFKNQAFPSDQFESVNSLILLYIYIYKDMYIYIYTRICPMIGLQPQPSSSNTWIQLAPK